MPLIRDGEKVSSDEIERIIKDFYPKGKDKTVTFVLTNYKPVERISNKGQKLQAPGGIQAHKLMGQTGSDGIFKPLHYYTHSTSRTVNDKTIVDYHPTTVEFRGGTMILDASKNKELFAFMLIDNRNESKSESAGRVPVYRLIDTSERSVKKVSTTSAKLEALNAVKKMFDNPHEGGAPKGKQAIAALYGGLKLPNFSDLWSSQSFEEIQANLYEVCETKPQDVLNKLKDTNTTTEAKIMEALETNIINYNASKQTFYWTKTGKKIFELPAGVNDEEANERLAVWLNKTDTTKALIEIEKQILDKLIEAEVRS